MKYALILCTLFCFGQKGQVYTFSFYNVENLFDAYDNPNTFDDDYTPEGRLQWTSALMHQKTAQLAAVISQIGAKETQRPPTVIGIAEVENKNLLRDLIRNKSLYHYIHINMALFIFKVQILEELMWRCYTKEIIFWSKTKRP